MKDNYLRSVSVIRVGNKCVNLCSHWNITGAEFRMIFSHLQNRGCWPEIVVLQNSLSLSSKPRYIIIFLIIWCILLPPHSILHDMFTWKNSSRSNNCGTHCMSIILSALLYIEFDTETANTNTNMYTSESVLSTDTTFELNWPGACQRPSCPPPQMSKIYISK